MNSFIHRIGLVAVLAWSAGASLAQDRLPDAVEAALKRNAEAMRQITVAWRETFSSNLPEKELFEWVGIPSRQTFLDPREYRYVRQDEKLYHFGKETHIVPPEPVFIRQMEWAHDGEHLFERGRYWFAPPRAPEESTMLSVYPATAPSGPCFRMQYFTAAGIEAPGECRRLRELPESRVLWLMRRENGQLLKSATNGAGHLELEIGTPSGRHTFELDPQLGHAVRRYSEFTADGRLMWHAQGEEFSELPHGVWLPQKIDCTFNAWSDLNNWHDRQRRIADKPILRVGIVVTELHANPTDSSKFRFDVNEAKPGDVVSDSRLPGAEKSQQGWISYVVPQNKAELDLAIREATRRIDWVRVEPASAPWRMILIVGNAILVLALIAAYFWRRSRLSYRLPW